ncbi:MAG TPA: CBS domain-containing protein [Acidimicrobiia bacterium]
MDINARAAVRDLVSGEPVSVDEDMTLRSVAAVLGAKTIGVALVRRAGRAPGIISERDVVKALAEDADPDTIWSADVMTEDLLAVDAGDRIIDVALGLVDQDVRHAVVFDGDRLLGVVSVRDLLRVVATELAASW